MDPDPDKQRSEQERQRMAGWPEHLRPFVEAHARYEQALAQALNEDRRAIEKITLEHWAALNAAQGDPTKAREAFNNYQAAMEKEQAASVERRKSCYRDYILAMQSSWAGADAEQYDPSSLHLIGSSMQAVAAESVWCGAPPTAAGRV